MSDVRRFTVVSFIWLTLWCSPSARGGPFDPWKELEGNKEEVQCLAFSPDGKLLASGGDGRSVRLWDVQTGKVLATLEVENAETLRLAFLPDNCTLIVTSVLPCALAHGRPGHPDIARGRLTWWNVKTKKVIRRINFPNTIWTSLSPDGKLLVSDSGISSEKFIRLMSAATGKETAQLKLNGYPGDLVISPDRKWLAMSLSKQREEMVQLWDLKTLKPVASISVHYLRDLTFSPDSKLLVCGEDSTKTGIILFDVSTRKIKDRLPGYCSSSLIVAPDGKHLLLARPGMVDIRDAKTGKWINGLQRFHLGEIRAMALSPDGTVVATAAVEDETIALWRLDKLLKQE